MKSLLKKYWFEFEIESFFDFPPGMGHGCGVTDYNLEDALNILDLKVFVSVIRLPYKTIVEDVNISKLGQGMYFPV